MSEILIIFLLLLLNGLFAMCEIALVSSKRSRLEQRAIKGSKGAKNALELLNEPERFLSTVQIGITLVGIIAGAYGAEAFTKEIQPYFENLTWIGHYAEEVSFTFIIVIITYFSLLIGELVPKSIAFNNPEAIASACAGFMKMLTKITWPFVWFLSTSTKLILKILIIKERKEPPVTEEELKYMIETGSQHGVIEKQEGEIMHSVFKFGDKQAESLMTPRNDIIWLNLKNDKLQMQAYAFQSAFTKYPVCEDSLDNIKGIISLRDVMHYAQAKESFDINEHILEPLFFLKGTPALKILDVFKKKKIHMGFVINERGETLGMVTLHDLVENIMGDFPEIGDNDEVKIIKRADGSLLVDGELKIEELKKLLGIESLSGEKNYSTLAGLIIYHLHTIPKAGDSLILHKHKFEIMDMDGNKIDKILIY